MGLRMFKAWMEEYCGKSRKEVVIPGMEPTGHYWFQPRGIPEGQRNETGSCESSPCEEIQRI